MECRTGNTANRKGPNVKASCQAAVLANSDSELTRLK